MCLLCLLVPGWLGWEECWGQAVAHMASTQNESCLCGSECPRSKAGSFEALKHHLVAAVSQNRSESYPIGKGSVNKFHLLTLGW